MLSKLWGCVFVIAFSFSAFAGPKKLETNLIVGVFNFSSEAQAEKIAEAAEKIKKSDTNFSSIIIAEIRKDTYGIYFTYRSNKKVNTPDKLIGSVIPFFADFGRHFEGQHISNSTITIKK